MSDGCIGRHILPKPTRRRRKAHSVHRCTSCGELFFVDAYDLDSWGNSGYRWKAVDKIAPTS